MSTGDVASPQSLPLHQVANGISLLNGLCGVGGIISAWHGMLYLAVFWFILGVFFDNLDGLAARKWGSTPMGPIWDSMADGVSHGLAPAASIAAAVPTLEGAVLAVLYATATIGRLTLVTVWKDRPDPEYFRGAPGPLGAAIAVSAAVLLQDHVLLLGAVVALGAVQMHSFDGQFTHPGRWAMRHRWPLVAIPIAWFGGSLFGFLVHPMPPTVLVLIVAVTYVIQAPSRYWKSMMQGKLEGAMRG